MKRVVSVSLGSSKRDKKVQATFDGVEFTIERIGADGDRKRYGELVRDLDGKVDAFGVGGMDLYLYAGNRRYTFREPLQMMAGAVKSPYVDGSGLKHTLERRAIQWLHEKGVMDFSRLNVLMVSGVDRFGMAEAMAGQAKAMVYGDLMFGLGIPIAIRSWSTFKRLASILLPIIVRLPFQWVYPTGQKQEVNTPKYERYFQWADVIAGDWHLIRRYAPAQLNGKTIITNTIRQADLEFLRERGVSRLITTTPEFGGESFGTNVMEAVIVALLGKRPAELTATDYLGTLERLGWQPRVLELEPASPETSLEAESGEQLDGQV